MNTDYKCRLAEIFQSGMMFQRDKEISLWGDAAPDTAVSVSLFQSSSPETSSGSLSAAPLLHGTCTADKDGHFLVSLPPKSAGEDYRIAVTFHFRCNDNLENARKTTSENTRTIMLENICFGDIWLAGGQSNMEFFLKYDRDWETVKKLPRNPNIRMYNVPQRAFEGHTTHNKTGYGYWFDDSNMQALECFSAPAYSFARNIQPEIGVPVGLIGCNWGGSTAAAWVPTEVLGAPPLDAYLREYEEETAKISPEKLTADSLSAWAFEDSAQHVSDFEPLLYGRDRDWQLQYMDAHAGDPVVPMGPYNFNRPGGLYQNMLSGLIPFSIKGVLWYQGESDAGERAFMYDKLLTALIECWREKWHDNFPFLIVQLAPFGVWLDCDNKGYAAVRERQAFVAGNVPDVYMAGIMDLGSYYDIHPKEKMEVGRRLALLARGHVYGEKGLLCDAPEAVNATVRDDGRIAVSFRHGDGLSAGERESDWRVCLSRSDTPSQVQDAESVAGDGQSAQHIIICPADVVAEDGLAILTLPDFAADGQVPIPELLSDSQVSLTVSLGWDDYAEIYLHNQAGLSAAPFKMAVLR